MIFYLEFMQFDIILSVCNESVNFSLEMLSRYWNSLPFRGGSIVSLPIRCKRRALLLRN